MSIFAEATDDLFANPDIARTVLYRPGDVGDGIAVRVIARRPDLEVGFADIAVHMATAVFEVRVAEVPRPAEGDTIALDGEIFVVQGEPVRDVERLVWTIDTWPR